MNKSILTKSLPASSNTIAAHEQVYKGLNFEDRQDFEDANRGFIAPIDGKVVTAKGRVVWDLEKIDFVNEGPSTETVNPSLWRNSQLHAIAGLFKVIEGVYQVRGQDIATMNFFEGKTGIIICDVLTSTEHARAAIELYYKHRPRKPIKAIIISQSHADHFGGINGVLSYVENDDIPIIAPKNFTKEVVSENLLLGSIMNRRLQYQMGTSLPVNEIGFVNAGIGNVLGSGVLGFKNPTIEIEDDVQTMVIDGLTFTFLLALNTEAPAEMHFYIQDYKVIYASENANKTMHQIYTVRGAKTRDALAWSAALDQTIDLYENEEIDALIMAHAWPVWGKGRVIEHLKLQRDLYKYMHDQTVRLANHGYTMDEIAESIQLPDTLNRYWGNRGYYGTLKHNCKGIYNYYLGYYSAHPSDLDPLPEQETGKKYIQYMGGINKIMQQAKVDYEKGEYRWVAQVLKHVIMSEPEHIDASRLLADTLEQLGYQSESPNWRNIYLVGAHELRNGINEKVFDVTAISSLQMPIDGLMKFLSVKLNGPKAERKKITFHLYLADLDKNFTLTIENAVLHVKEYRTNNKSDIDMKADRSTFQALMFGKRTLEQARDISGFEMKCGQTEFEQFVSLFDSFNLNIPIVTP